MYVTDYNEILIFLFIEDYILTFFTLAIHTFVWKVTGVEVFGRRCHKRICIKELGESTSNG